MSYTKRINEIQQAIERLKEAGEKASMSNVAKQITGIKSLSALSHWVKNNKVDLAAYGIEAGDPGRKGVNKQERLAEIRAAVQKLKREGKKPRLSQVIKQVSGVNSSVALTNWANNYGIDLRKLGVLIGAPRGLAFAKSAAKLQTEKKQAVDNVIELVSDSQTTEALSN